MLKQLFIKLRGEYSMLVVLVLLCGYYSWATVEHRRATGPTGGAECASQLLKQPKQLGNVVIAVGTGSDNTGFAEEAKRRLQAGGVAQVHVIAGDPHQVRSALQQLINHNTLPTAIACTPDEVTSLDSVLQRLHIISSVPVVVPQMHAWPSFLTSSNLLNVTNQIVVIAIIAVGMTMVIITGGIDLSVGNLVALSAVVTGMLIRDHAGGAHATTPGLILCSAAGVSTCGLAGAVSGLIKTIFNVPPFIVTLAMMRVTLGLAYSLSDGQSIYDIPSSFVWLGRGIGIAGIPNAVMLMVFVYIIAHITLSRTRLGRYIYAVGGNSEAARLSGVGVNGVLITVYIISGLSAGLGGVIVASQLKGSSPTYGLGYELYVIAAVVVGGTSLAGGEGNVIGTLIGALIIAVIQNGMNLTGVQSYHQQVVLGLVILGAVLLDSLKRTKWRLPDWVRRSQSVESTIITPAQPRETSVGGR